MADRSVFRRLRGAALPAAVLPAALALTVASPGLSGQVADEGDFGEGRAWISDTTIFAPFHVTDDDIGPLRDAVADGIVQPGTWLVIMGHDAGRLAMVMDQMAYHHVAQGEVSGEPWMVSF